MKLSDYKHVHCIGIGGIGLSAIARYMMSQGAVVSGSDGQASRITDDLRKEGAFIYIGHDASHVKDGCDLVIYSIAVSDTNEEFIEASKRGITCLSYPEALGMLTKEYTTIAVCGTHGKTTTTAMIASMLEAVGKKPTVLVGSLLAEGGTNFQAGESEYLVVEACEYKRSFLNLHPTHVVVTNIDADHLDYYKDITDITSAFQTFADMVPPQGFLVTHTNVFLQTTGHKVNADLVDPNGIELSVLGNHNHRNAQLALSLSNALGFEEMEARIGLKAFTGTWRRLEYKGKTSKGVKVYDDYGHHPAEIKATIQALREAYPDNPLHVFFQPHLFSRTKIFLDDFARSFAQADKVYVMPIYASRETSDGTISHHDLVQKMKDLGVDVVALGSIEEMSNLIESIDDSRAIVLNSGAGDAYTQLNMLSLS